MKWILMLGTACIMAVGISGAMNGQSAADTSQAGDTISAVLENPLDAATAKKGDRVTARVSESGKSGNQMNVPQGAELTGHITEVKRKSGDRGSSLGIVFDHFVTPNGSQKPLHVEISSIGRPENASPESMSGSITGPSSSMGGTAASRAGVGGAGGTRGGAPQGTAEGARGAENTPQYNNPKHTKASEIHKGVIGLPGLMLDPNAPQGRGSLIRSKTGDVRLASGTRLLLRIVSSPQ